METYIPVLNIIFLLDIRRPAAQSDLEQPWGEFRPASMWQQGVAFQRADSDAETRLAGDGRRYTKAEFIEYYTYNGQEKWDKLSQMPTAPHRPAVNSMADSRC